MIKINVILSNFSWKKYLKNPKRLIDQSIRIINKKDKTYKKKLFIFTKYFVFSIQSNNSFINIFCWAFYEMIPFDIINNYIKFYHQCFFFDKP